MVEYTAVMWIISSVWPWCGCDARSGNGKLYFLNLWQKMVHFPSNSTEKIPWKLCAFCFFILQSVWMSYTNATNGEKSFWGCFFLTGTDGHLTMCFKINRLGWSFRLEITIWSHIYYEITTILITSQSQFNSRTVEFNATSWVACNSSP